MTWASPQRLTPFADDSPFRGLNISDDVTVSRQVLAEPSVELADHTWARLTDGTPLVTGTARGRGWIVLFHVAASPGWSTLPISGLYVDMLRRMIELSEGVQGGAAAARTGTFPPYQTLDGYGRLEKPFPEATPIRASEIESTNVGPLHPPGLYGVQGALIALNAFGTRSMLVPLDIGRSLFPYSGTAARELKWPLLELALIILLLDALISLWLRGYISANRRKPRARVAARPAALLVLVMALAFAASPSADAAPAPAPPRPRRARGRRRQGPGVRARHATRLCHHRRRRSRRHEPGRPVRARARAPGAHGLRAAPRRSASISSATICRSIPCSIGRCRRPRRTFPPRPPPRSNASCARAEPSCSTPATRRSPASRREPSPGEATLRRLLTKLDIPPLEPIPEDHVITRTFYLLKEFPGRWSGGQVWVEALPPQDPSRPPEGPVAARGGDGVSPIIMGGNDWAAAWARDETGQPIAAVVPGGEQQRETAIRFGINVVIYAMTGNYKTDQVHVPALLERLGK